jgi:dihydroorotate dehydrogenase
VRVTDALLQRALFLLEPEASHHTALGMLGAVGRSGAGRALLHALYGAHAASPVELCGLTFPNRVGLAAGYDKGGTAWKGLAAIGFGHVEVGTITPRAQPGNPSPRVFRLEAERAVINRMGFPSEGAAQVRPRLDAERPYGVVLGVNLGKNKDTPNEDAATDYVDGVTSFGDVADYLTVNVSSPNTPGLRALQSGPALRALLTRVVSARDALLATRGRPLPVWVKIAPDLDDADLDDALGAVFDARIDGVIATNTTLDRAGVDARWASEAGGLSGAPLTAKAAGLVTRLRRRAGDRLPIVGVGGIMSGDDARARLDAGADLVQLYTGLIYGGPGLVSEVVAATDGWRGARRQG